jgi:hypothetical protein
MTDAELTTAIVDLQIKVTEICSVGLLEGEYDFRYTDQWRGQQYLHFTNSEFPGWEPGDLTNDQSSRMANFLQATIEEIQRSLELKDVVEKDFRVDVLNTLQNLQVYILRRLLGSNFSLDFRSHNDVPTRTDSRI